MIMCIDISIVAGLRGLLSVIYIDILYASSNEFLEIKNSYELIQNILSLK